MRLNNLKINPVYNSYDDDIINDFYNKVFECANYYDRASAYFDSNILSLYAQGLEKIYENKGKVRFLFSHQIEEKDYELIRQGYLSREVEKKLIDSIQYEELNDEEKIDFSNLALLISEGLVDVKIAYTKSGIFHDKFGLIYDNLNNYIYFRGSNNETVAAVKHSYESFETSCSWDNYALEDIKIETHIKAFNNLWENNVKDILVLDIPEAIKNKIINYKNDKFITRDEIKFENTFVMDLGKNNTFIVKNFLTPNKIDVRDRIFKVFLKKYLVCMENDNLQFKDGLSYIEIRKIIDYINDYSVSNNFRTYTTERLKKYINNMDIKIEKRKNLGIDIKNHNDLVIDKFNEFSNIIDTLMLRKLRPMQKWNAFHIVCMIKSANFSVPGAGKTSIVYGAYAYLNRQDDMKVNKIVMIGPKNSFISWEDEFLLNFGENGEKKKLRLLDSQKYSRKDLIEKLEYESSNYNLILINYERMDSIKDSLKKAIDDKTLLVFDEIHRIKAINGVWASAALDICVNAKYKVALTGTPIPNSYADLYNILKILYYDEYDSFFKFKAKELANADERRMVDINEQVFPFYCRTTKKDLEIPIPNEDLLINCEMNKQEKRLFEIIHQRYRGNILSMYIRLLQASNNPYLLTKDLDDYTINSFLYNEEEEITDNNLGDYVDKKVYLDEEIKNLINQIGMTTKYKKGINLVENLVNENKQVLVWGIFVNTLEKIKYDLMSRGISCDIISGSTSAEDRKYIITKFKKGDINVLITNPHTLAESVSLHKNCHDAVYFEYSFNLTHMIQSKDRINRLGLEKDDYTQYYYLFLNNDDVYNNSIDYKTYKRLKEKEKIMIESIENTTLTRIDFDDLEDIRQILSEI
jgi:superfamily II DNA or RNA helicase